MSYSLDYKASAKRHLQAAMELDGGHRRDVAGYLYGVAAECALKELMRQSGMRPRSESERREDPFFQHFPELKTRLAEDVQGRWAGTLRKYAEDGAFMNGWDTAMRYAPAKDVPAWLVERWKGHATEICGKMDERS